MRNLKSEDIEAEHTLVIGKPNSVILKDFKVDRESKSKRRRETRASLSNKML
jgi:hypothetical protein